jgi:hypothetical protein
VGIQGHDVCVLIQHLLCPPVEKLVLRKGHRVEIAAHDNSLYSGIQLIVREPAALPGTGALGSTIPITKQSRSIAISSV